MSCTLTRDTVSFTLSEVERRRKKRMELLPENHAEALQRLRRVMFGRQEKDEAFHPLTEEELVLLEWAIRRYDSKNGGPLIVCHGDHKDAKGVKRAYYPLRRDYIEGGFPLTSPAEFRAASDIVVDDLLVQAMCQLDIRPERDLICVIWRAGLAFLSAAKRRGFNWFVHLGMARDEKTAKPETYFREKILVTNPEARILICDPMLATGGSLLEAIEVLRGRGFSNGRIRIASVIVAPEGVVRVLQGHPGVRMVVGALDEGLDPNAYIKPGIGDFGDRLCDGLHHSRISEWHTKGMLSYEAALALQQRMDAMARLS